MFKGTFTKGVDLTEEEPLLEAWQGATARQTTKTRGNFPAARKNTSHDGQKFDGIRFLPNKGKNTSK